MQKHAKLSASGSHRWILCPGSVKAEEKFPDIRSKYADEGVLAHEIAAAILNKEDISSFIMSSEMQENIQIYTDYVLQLAPQEIWYPEIYIEKTVDFSHIVPYGFGTADAIIISNNTLHIVDLKYGMGNNVTAYENTQLLLYAIGMYHNIKLKDSIDTIILHIVQPRTNNFDKWSLSIKEMSFFEGYFKAKAEEALRDNAPRIPNESACKWCKANSTCPALYKFAEEVIDQEDEIDDSKIKNIIENAELIKNFVNSVKNKVYEKLSSGLSFPGYKLVPGRNVRKIRTDSNNKIFELLGEKAYSKSLIGVTELEKLVDKETLKSLVYISSCKPVLVTESDKREALRHTELEFDAVEEDLKS